MLTGSEPTFADHARRLIRGHGSARETLTKSMRFINFAWLTVVASVGLSLVGMYAIDLSSSLEPIATTGLTPDAAKQLVFTIVGLLAAVVIALPHYRVLGWMSWPLMLVCLLMLVFLLIPFVPSALVRPRNGARAWIDLGPVDFQPSELTKIAFVLVVAHYLRFRTGHRTLRGLLVPGLIAGVPVALITLQPDLGTASLFVPALFAMLIAAGARKRHLLLIVAASALAAPAAYPFLKPHQKQRIVAMIAQIEGDQTTADDINYQSFTAQTLIGSGQSAGNTGLGARALVRYNRLPEAHNDMIYAVVCARFGLVGGLGVIGLYLVWIVGALGTAASCREPIGRLIAVGLPAFVAAQMVINIGMNVGLVPIIGITLPFVSAGGSSMLASWLMTGLILNVAIHRPRPPFRKSFEYEDEDEPDEYLPGGFTSAGFQGRVITD